VDEQKIEQLIADHRHFHSEFQIEHFIVGTAGPTQWGRYKQAVHELERRQTGLRSAVVQLERARLRLGRLKRWCWVPWRREDRRLNILEATTGIADMERTISDTERERREFFRLACAMKADIGDLTEEKRARLETRYWFEHLRHQSLLEYHTTGGINKNTLEAVLAIPQSAEILAGVLGVNVAEQIETAHCNGASPRLEGV